MAWEEIEPQSTRSSVQKDTVTVAWRQAGTGHHGMRLFVALGKATMEKVRWVKGDKMRIQLDREAGKLRFSKATVSGFAVHVKHTTGYIGVRLDNAPMNKAMPAELVTHSMDGDALIVDLPAWAYGAPAAKKAAPVVAAAPAPPAPARRIGLMERLPDPMAALRAGRHA